MDVQELASSEQSGGSNRLEIAVDSERSTNVVQAPRWAFHWLWAAGIYNLAWGLATICFPHLLFDLTGAKRINYPEIWQCVGMIVGVYGIAYILAAYDSRRHWPVVLVGLLGKIFGPIGFVGALIKGTFPLAFGAPLLTNDLLWWIPFTLILRDAWRSHRPTTDMTTLRPTKLPASD